MRPVGESDQVTGLGASTCNNCLTAPRILLEFNSPSPFSPTRLR